MPRWPLAEAAFYGALSALIFTLWPLGADRTHPRRGALPRRRGHPRLAAQAVPGGAGRLGLALIGSATWLSGIPELALGAAGGDRRARCWSLRLRPMACARWRAGWPARALTHGRPATRAALAAIGAPRSEATPVILSLGLGLSVLAAVGQIDWNLRAAIATDLPTRAPAFFFVDIQPDQMKPFLDARDERPCGDRGGKRADAARRRQPDQRPPRA